MARELNHLIVHCRDRRESAAFLAHLMDAPAPRHWGVFSQVDTANGVGIDFADSLVPHDRINESHLAFLVSDGEFDAVMARLRKRSIPFWPDHFRSREGRINHAFGGRGVYTLDPGGTVVIECITAPYDL
ncbi:VOC family protein [Streptomyces sp. SID11385]|uniref:VOC family protein n=1 Tax=Streptomyces sp. SID11385 TaxID=2706031 RepID=UPI0013C85250|nr:VOC family protein [Streptomyces sp. SID11385]NEA44697.1 VOC family protein [Streptomyces sp. SID11385]